MHDGYNLHKMNVRSDLICSILWVLMAFVMIACLVAGIGSGNPFLICVALFAFSIDGVNAYRYFRQWLAYRRVMKDLKERGIDIE